MKKLIFLLTLLLSMASSAFAVEEVEIDGLWYELVSKSKEAKVIKYKNNVKYSGDIVIPESVEYERVNYIVTSIGVSAFQRCYGMTSVKISSNVTSIGHYAFVNCSGLTSVTILNGVTSIGNSAFYGCSGLASITIGSGIKTIGSQAFAKCPELTDVYCYAETVPSMTEFHYNISCTDAFEDSYIDYATLHVPTASIEAYKAVEPWKNFNAIIGMDGTPEDPEVKKCATPTISYIDGKLAFDCETEGVEYVSEVTVGDAKKNYSSEVSLSGLYKVSVYATKAGYDNSDVATLEFTLGPDGEVCDVNKDGKVDVADIATIIDRMAGKK